MGLRVDKIEEAQGKRKKMEKNVVDSAITCRYTRRNKSGGQGFCESKQDQGPATNGVLPRTVETVRLFEPILMSLIFLCFDTRLQALWRHCLALPSYFNFSEYVYGI